jgi:hypothetical protein
VIARLGFAVDRPRRPCYALSYEIAEDKDAYYLPAFISIAIAAGLGIQWLIQRAPSRRSMWTASVADCPDIGYSVRRELPFNNRRHYSLRLIMLRTLQHDRAQWTDAHPGLAGRVSYVVRARNRTTPWRCESSGYQSVAPLVVFRLSKHAIQV